MRIIHVVENLHKGAVENWLVNVFLNSRKTHPEWEWTFYCILGKEGRLDDKVRQAGGIIIYSPVTISKKLSFLKHLRTTLKSGNYNIIHSHHDYLSGFYLLASAGINFKKRILHIHNTDKALPVGNKKIHDILLAPFRKLALHFSDIIVGISSDTLSSFAGKQKKSNKIYCVIYYGIDLIPFHGQAKISLHTTFNIPQEAIILLFAGRMTRLKNPGFVMDIMKELKIKSVNAYGVFVGAGDEESTVIEKAAKYNLQGEIKMIGWRDDIADIMKAADIFIFPRIEFPKEGLGLVVVEAQAAGLPMLITKGIVEDAIVINELTHVLPLNNNPREWADTIIKIKSNEQIKREVALKKMEASKFNIVRSTQAVTALYEA